MARKQKMKVYHGIPKSITDEHTILYASFDGVITPEVGSMSFNSSINYQFHPYVTGLGLKTSTPELFTHHSVKCDVITCEFYADFTILNSASNSVPYFKISIGNLFYRIEKSGSSIVFASSTMQNPSSFAVSKLISLPLTTITTYSHYRVVMNSRTGEVTTYINGKTIGTNTLAFNFSSNVLDIANKMQFAPSKGQLVSDFHVSNIDRGDYFSNLPQDFIEGKAVIKPRMGQQQIKGDPMYSQVTNVKIPAFTNETSKLYCRYDNNTKGYLKDNPEIFDVVNANEWNQGSTFKIRGLNGEAISANTTPTVKTKNGAIVLGAWSSLGTNVVTFTLADNASSLKGQDLYVEYSLTMPYGNSDFPELPHTVDRAWGENGVEMKPVDNITIIDDYYRKLVASNEECPHKTRWRYLANINEPPSVGSEDTQFEYDRIATLDGQYRAIGTGDTVIIPQKVFSFNLLEMVERKIGVEVPSANKVQWLKDNLATINFNFYGYGSCPSGNKVHVVNYYTDTSRWNDKSWSHSSNSVQCLKCGIPENLIAKVIDSVGFVHFLAYTDISTSTTPSEIVTDYASIEVILKTDSTFTTLYCDNTRAREDKCNPVLIQKETKTVKRYLPSKECFTTECKTYGFRGTTSPTELYSDSTKALAIRDYQLNSMGTGQFLTYFNYFEYIASLCNITKEAPYQFDSSSIGDNVGQYYGSSDTDPKFGGGIMYIPRGLTFANRPWGNMIDTSKVRCQNFIHIIPYLMMYKGEVVLCLINSIFKNSRYTKEEVYYFPIKNRPLIK